MSDLTPSEYAKENGFSDYESMINYIDNEKKVTEDNQALVEQNKALIEALEHIKKHQEMSMAGMPQLSVTWKIANRALEKTK